MARLLVCVKGEKKGRPVVAFPDKHVFGRMEDFEEFTKSREAKDWPGDFVIVDTDMPLEEAQALCEEVVEYGEPVPHENPAFEGETYTPATIKHNSRGLIDYESLERREPGSGRDTLNTIKKIARDAAAVRAATTERQ